jgi:hypothetical protein
MTSSLDPRVVARRLAGLRLQYVPESLEDARARLERERPIRSASFADTVQRRLAELRALCELATHLQRRGHDQPSARYVKRSS